MTQPKTRELLNDLIKERTSFILNSVQSIFEQIDSEKALINSYLFIAELDGIESDLDHIDVLDNESYYELQNVIKEMLDDCSKSNFKKVGKFLIRLVRKETI